jgi:hypothetical protein
MNRRLFNIIPAAVFMAFFAVACSETTTAPAPIQPELVVVSESGSGDFKMASSLPFSRAWDGQGSDSKHCHKLGESPERTIDGWMHWIVTQSSMTAAELVLGGSGTGTYSPTKLTPIAEFFTPYFDVVTLTAILNYAGTLAETSQFTLSDYCPPGDFERLDVSKTAATSFTREHFWDIDKSVDTENEYTVDDDIAKVWLYIDGSGDETATWTVDVTYEGYEDSGWNVSGEITIENTGTLDAVITAVDDVLGGTTITVNCGVTFPYTLPVGETLTCYYDEDGYVEGNNVVTVTTERDTYSATEPVTWGTPTTEINETVNVKDISDLFGEVELGTVTAPNDRQFTYDKDFAWADYGADGCGSFQYDNTATIVETGQEANATLKVNVQCFVYETAYAKDDDAMCFIPSFNNWGWTNPIKPGTYEMDLWAGAAGCDTSKGTLVGSVSVSYNGSVDVTFNVDPAEYDLKETHVYAGYDMFPQVTQGRRTVSTVAPGQYRNLGPFDGSQVYVIAHGVVGLPDPKFGPQD